MYKIKIRKNHHKPCFSIGKILKTRNIIISKTFSFTESCWFWFDNPNKDGDCSKLIGFMNGYDIHDESYRIGFRSLKDGKIEFVTYIYQKGVRLDFRPLLTIDKTDSNKYTFKIIKEDFKVSFQVFNARNIKIGEYSLGAVNNYSIGFTTNIFIGGGLPNGKDWKAPHDVIIYRY